MTLVTLFPKNAHVATLKMNRFAELFDEARRTRCTRADGGQGEGDGLRSLRPLPALKNSLPSNVNSSA